MHFFKNLSLTLIAAAALSGCEAGATLRIHSVLLGADGTALEQLLDELVLGETAQRFTDKTGESYLVSLPAIIDESCLSSLEVSENLAGPGAILNFTFTDDCAKTFGEYTAKHIGTEMAVVVNGELKSVPRIAAPITAGAGFVGGFDSLAEAEGIAESLK